MSVNKVILLGYVGRDPEIRFPQPGFQLAMLTLATNGPVGILLPKSPSGITS